jgi:hypothetical protein
MAPSPFRERRYRPEEARSVVQHALAQDADPAAGRTLTRDELDALLSDLGVSAAAAARAMDEAGAAPEGGDENQDDWLGGPKRIVFEGEVDGELADERREDVVEIIREVLGDAGRVESLGRTVTWAPTPSVNNQQRRLSVKVRVRDGRTKIRVDEDLTPVRFGSWFGFGMGGGMGLGVIALLAGKAARSAAVAVLVWGAILLVSFFLAWAVTRAVSHRRKKELRRLFDKVRGEVERGAVARPRVAAGDLARGAPPKAGQGASPADTAASDQLTEEEEEEAAAVSAPARGRRALARSDH